MNKVKSVVKSILLIGLFWIGFKLVISIINSGYFYQYDRDEIIHVQTSYLLLKNFRPFTGFYSTFTPLFHLFIAPVFVLTGFSFISIQAVRILMIVLFGIRLVLIAAVIKKIFGLKTALIFLPVYLLDPFTIFSGMQIRPDNLMIVIYLTGLLVFTDSYLKNAPLKLLLSGFLFGLSLLILLKSAVLTGTVYLFAFYLGIKHKKIGEFLILMTGMLIVILLFLSYYFISGSLLPMITQVFILGPKFASYGPNSTYFGFFNSPDNAYVFGLMGKPIGWYYVWTLPLLGAAGAFAILHRAGSENNKKSELKLLILFSLIFEYLTLMLLTQVFLAYYIPLQWLLAVFTAVLLSELIEESRSGNIFNRFILIGLGVFFLLLISDSVTANNMRATFRPSDFIGYMKQIWSVVPENLPTFPNVLFRPVGYPLQFGYEEYKVTFPAEVKKLLPDYIRVLEAKQIPFLVIDDRQKFNELETGMDEYVNRHYSLVNGSDNIWKRKVNIQP